MQKSGDLAIQTSQPAPEDVNILTKSITEPSRLDLMLSSLSMKSLCSQMSELNQNVYFNLQLLGNLRK
jgi:hypothetical protein